MIRLALQCAFVFLLPALLYFGYVLLAKPTGTAADNRPRTTSELLDEAPLVWLFALGTLFLFGTLLAFATGQEQNIEKPYEPAIFKDGKIQLGKSN